MKTLAVFAVRCAAVIIALATVPGALGFGAYLSALALSALVLAMWRRHAVLAMLLAIVAPVLLVLEYQQRIIVLSKRYEIGGAHALTTRDRLSIFALNLEMAIGGFVLGFREAAFETTLMAMRQRSAVDGDGAFLLDDPKIRRTLNSALADRRTIVSLPAPRWRYDPRTESLRVGLAVNGAQRMTIRRDGSTAHVTLPILITYPKEGKLVLVPSLFGRPLYIDEGLFHALEQLGWLTSYEMRWHTSVTDDDERVVLTRQQN